MASIPKPPPPKEIDYPDSDGKPVAETTLHRDNLLWRIWELQRWFLDDPQVYVSGNMFLYYVQGDRRRHVSPDVFVVKGIPKHPPRERRRYLLWEEGKGPDWVLEITSASTRKEDLEVKFALYRDTLKVQEYFLFDPESEYLVPPLKGYRLQRGRYVPIRPVRGRLPSKVLGLHLEQDDWQVRLYDPQTGRRLLNPFELAAEAEEVERARQQAEAEHQRAEAERQQAEAELQRAEAGHEQEKAARLQAEAEIERLRRQIEALRGKPPTS